MKMPGFTGDASLYRASRTYQHPTPGGGRGPAPGSGAGGWLSPAQWDLRVLDPYSSETTSGSSADIDDRACWETKMCCINGSVQCCEIYEKNCKNT